MMITPLPDLPVTSPASIQSSLPLGRGMVITDKGDLSHTDGFNPDTQRIPVTPSANFTLPIGATGIVDQMLEYTWVIPRNLWNFVQVTLSRIETNPFLIDNDRSYINGSDGTCLCKSSGTVTEYGDSYNFCSGTYSGLYVDQSERIPKSVLEIRNLTADIGEMNKKDNTGAWNNYTVDTDRFCPLTAPDPDSFTYDVCPVLMMKSAVELSPNDLEVEGLLSGTTAQHSADICFPIEATLQVDDTSSTLCGIGSCCLNRESDMCIDINIPVRDGYAKLDRNWTRSQSELHLLCVLERSIMCIVSVFALTFIKIPGGKGHINQFKKETRRERLRKKPNLRAKRA